MIRRIRKLLDRPLLQDSLRFFGVTRAPIRSAGRGILQENGQPVSVEEIMLNFGVSRGQAVEISRRQSK